MMTSYFNLLKYAATGIASPDMTYYDKMRASTLMGGVVQTLTGIPPLSFKSDGTPLISWSMLGNGQQTGTPTPDNPVMPTFCGLRTANLIPVNDVTVESGNAYANFTLARFNLDAGTYRLSVSWSQLETVTSIAIALRNDVTNENIKIWFLIEESGDVVGTFTLTEKTAVKFVVWPNNTSTPKDVKCRFYDIMLNLGSTALPYEPFGWAEKITCAGQTVPVYLGQVRTVRRIKKLVLTSTTVDWFYDSTYNRYAFKIADSLIVGVRLTPVACSHFVSISDGRSIGDVPNNAIYSNAQQTTNNWFIKTTDYTTASSFKQFLDDELAAGHPVTVWYILSSEQTGITNEPLCKISTYADELSSEDASATIPTVKGSNTLTVDTPIQPSEMTITFKG